MVKKIALATALTLVSLTTFAKDHSADYQVGTFTATQQVSDGFYEAACNLTGCTTHNVHYVETPDGEYDVAAPVSTGGSILLAVLTNGNAPANVRIQWFMDDLHEGDKVLFYAKCNRHNNCTFWIPKPDKPGREYITSGSFHPRVAKTNATQLCGTGKLSAAVEAQVCPKR